MMETEEQKAGSCPAPGQSAVRTWLTSSTRGAPRTPSDSSSRFSGDGVRYKAKLIGVDAVPDAMGEKMCWDSMMKLKGFEAAARKQGKHKQRVWLKVSSSGLKIIDEKTGLLKNDAIKDLSSAVNAVLHDQDRSRITSWMKDESDPRALAYVYRHQDTFSLFYIKMANLADPVLVDMEEVCQVVDGATAEEPAEAPTQTSSLLLLNDNSDPPAEGPALEDVFSSQPDCPTGQSNQTSSNELRDVFSIPMGEPLIPSQSSCVCQPESPQPKLSSTQILSMFPTQPYSSPPYSPTTIPWAQHGMLGSQWAGPTVAPWPTMANSVPTWAPASSQIEAPYSQPGAMRGGSTPASPTAANGFPAPLNPLCVPTGVAVPRQSAPPISDYNQK